MHRRLRSVHKNWSRGIECYSVRCPAWRTFPTRLLNAHQVYRCTTRWKGPIDEFLRDAFWVNTPVHMKSAYSRFFFIYMELQIWGAGNSKNWGGGGCSSFVETREDEKYVYYMVSDRFSILIKVAGCKYRSALMDPLHSKIFTTRSDQELQHFTFMAKLWREETKLQMYIRLYFLFSFLFSSFSFSLCENQ